MLKNITLSADEIMIEQARTRAVMESTSLNELFRGWLERYVVQSDAAEQYDALMGRLSYVEAGQTFTRDEMNERR